MVDEKDPYDSPEERAEIFVWNGKVYWDGLFSTYREIHISIRGFYAGLKCGAFEDLPKCPVMWSDEGQYYEGFAAIAYECKRYGLGALAGGLILKFVLPIIGG
jgi:hypothetical protein